MKLSTVTSVLALITAAGVAASQEYIGENIVDINSLNLGNVFEQLPEGCDLEEQKTAIQKACGVPVTEGHEYDPEEFIKAICSDECQSKYVDEFTDVCIPAETRGYVKLILRSSLDKICSPETVDEDVKDILPFEEENQDLGPSSRPTVLTAHEEHPEILSTPIKVNEDKIHGKLAESFLATSAVDEIIKNLNLGDVVVELPEGCDMEEQKRAIQEACGVSKSEEHDLHPEELIKAVCSDECQSKYMHEFTDVCISLESRGFVKSVLKSNFRKLCSPDKEEDNELPNEGDENKALRGSPTGTAAPAAPTTAAVDKSNNANDKEQQTLAASTENNKEKNDKKKDHQESSSAIILSNNYAQALFIVAGGLASSLFLGLPL